MSELRLEQAIVRLAVGRSAGEIMRNGRTTFLLNDHTVIVNLKNPSFKIIPSFREPPSPKAAESFDICPDCALRCAAWETRVPTLSAFCP